MKDLQTKCVGRCADGTQFFLNDFETAECQGLILYLFDADGNYESHQAWLDGYPADIAAAQSEILSRLEPLQFRDINVRQCQIRIDGVDFGLIPDPDQKCIHLQPGSQITFMDPWDGEYYT